MCGSEKKREKKRTTNAIHGPSLQNNCFFKQGRDRRTNISLPKYIKTNRRVSKQSPKLCGRPQQSRPLHAALDSPNRSPSPPTPPLLGLCCPLTVKQCTTDAPQMSLHRSEGKGYLVFPGRIEQDFLFLKFGKVYPSSFFHSPFICIF